jgi:integral membrane protein (TIGR01906 family)
MRPISATREQQPSRLGIRLLQVFIAVAFPVLLVLLNARLVMSPAFLYFEYTRPDFPDDYYGLTMQDRLNYAPYAINYLLNGADITYLGDLRFADGAPLFNERELRHMHDVKLMTQIAFGGALIVSILAITAGYVLLHLGRLTRALMQGSMATLGLIATIVIVAIFSWDTFFTGFHSLFFADGTWYFAYSDTLIRLFPEQFWFDAALLVGGLTTLQAGLVLLVIWYHHRRRAAVAAAGG